MSGVHTRQTVDEGEPESAGQQSMRDTNDAVELTNLEHVNFSSSIEIAMVMLTFGGRVLRCRQKTWRGSCVKQRRSAGDLQRQLAERCDDADD